MLWIYAVVVLLPIALFQKFGLCSRNAGVTQKSNDTALIKIPAVRAPITYFSISASKSK